MITVHVVLTSAVTGKITELARMKICNDGTGDYNKRHYDTVTFIGRSTEHLNRETPKKSTHIQDWPAERFHIWNLIAKCLKQMGYTEGQ